MIIVRGLPLDTGLGMIIVRGVTSGYWARYDYSKGVTSGYWARYDYSKGGLPLDTGLGSPLQSPESLDGCPPIHYDLKT